MIRLTLGEVVGYRFGRYKLLSAVNPYAKRVTVDEMTTTSFMTWEELKKAFGIEIVPTTDEQAMIDRGCLALQVEEKAKDLRETLEKWLLSEKAR